MAAAYRVLVDHDVEGQVEEIVLIWSSPDWAELWHGLGFHVITFQGIGLPTDTADAAVWQLCQAEQMVLITGNRNAEGEDSLEQTSQRLNNASSLPVLTIADPKRVIFDREYATQVAGRILDYLFQIEQLRGTRRLFVP
jgi:hypothetical protein